MNKSFPRTPFKKLSKKDIAKIFSGSVLYEQNCFPYGAPAPYVWQEQGFALMPPAALRGLKNLFGKKVLKKLQKLLANFQIKFLAVLF